jgi:tetratricopeptide (TPR) repeat protein
MILRHKNTNAFILVVSLILTGLLSSCVPEVVKHNAEGNEQFEQGAYTEALDAYRLAQVSEPDQPEPYYNAANTYNRQGDVGGTALQTEQALKSSDPDLQAKAWYNLGNAHFDAQQWQQAVEAYKAALRLDSTDSDAKHNLELAMQAIQDQQQQSEEQQKDQEQQNENQQQDEQEQSGETSSDDEQSQEQNTQGPESQEQQSSEQNQAAPEQEQNMTPEQAQQLLESLLGDSETLQEYLQQYFQAPGAEPEEDW